MASQAGSRGLKPEKWKSAPRLFRRTFSTDWLRLKHYIFLCEIAEDEAVKWLPNLLEDELFSLYLETAEREGVKTLDAAKSVLDQFIGTKSVSFEDFTSRKWKTGEETVSAFMGGLQNMGRALQLPDGMIKSQFLAGIPRDAAKSLRAGFLEEESCAKLTSAAERIIGDSFDRVESVSESTELEDLKKTVQKLNEEVAAMSWKNGQPAQATVPTEPASQCFRCHGYGHMARECPSGGGFRGGRSQYGGNRGGRDRGSFPGDRRCYACGAGGHIARSCPQGGPGGYTSGPPRGYSQRGNGTPDQQQWTKNSRGPVLESAKY
jgi:Zinc knuckle